MNIAPPIRMAAEKRRLGFAITGGVCDFVIKQFGEGTESDTELILSSEDVGASPSSLMEPGTVTIMRVVGTEWADRPNVTLHFKTVRDAMNFMEATDIVEFYD